MIEVTIDVKPNSDRNCFCSDGIGVIPVAVLGTADFDVKLIDLATPKLYGAPVAARNAAGHLMAGYKD